jgi:hypothetical protein
MAKTMPRQQPGRSVQDVRTPREFLAATRALLGIEAFAVDLAATRAEHGRAEVLRRAREQPRAAVDVRRASAGVTRRLPISRRG